MAGTAMLAGVSHDLRTVLTRFKLELALIKKSPEVEAMQKDVDEMARMLEAYLAFARGDLGESAAPTDMAAFLAELKDDAERNGHKVSHGGDVYYMCPGENFGKFLCVGVQRALEADVRHHRSDDRAAAQFAARVRVPPERKHDVIA